MFWEIAHCVVRGVFDNRERGRVTGHVWLGGRAEPLELALRGDALRDLAGRRLEFFNRHPRPVGDGLDFLAGVQRGAVGECTASLRAKVPDAPGKESIPLTSKEKQDRLARPKDFGFRPTHWVNQLHLEWFVPDFGRVSLSSSDFRLVVSRDIRWDMTLEEEYVQRIINHEELRALFIWELENLRREMDRPEPEEDDEPRGW